MCINHIEEKEREKKEDKCYEFNYSGFNWKFW